MKANNETVVMKPGGGSDYDDFDDYETEDGTVIVPMHMEGLHDNDDDAKRKSRKNAPRKIEKDEMDDMAGSSSGFTGGIVTQGGAGAQGGDTNEDKPYKCELCHWQFKQRYRFKRHMRTHTGERPYACPHPDCGKTFSRSHILKVHMMIHSGDKPFRCEECGWSFMKKYHLQRHQRTHTGEMPFVCAECGVHFSRPYYLKKHMVQAHGAIIDEVGTAAGNLSQKNRAKMEAAAKSRDGMQLEDGECGIGDGGVKLECVDLGDLAEMEDTSCLRNNSTGMTTPPPLISMVEKDKSENNENITVVTTTSPYFQQIKTQVPSLSSSNPINNDNNSNNNNNNNNDSMTDINANNNMNNQPSSNGKSSTDHSAITPPPATYKRFSPLMKNTSSTNDSNNNDNNGDISSQCMKACGNKTVFPYNMDPKMEEKSNIIHNDRGVSSPAYQVSQNFPTSAAHSPQSRAGNQYFVTPGNRNINPSYPSTQSQYKITSSIMAPQHDDDFSSNRGNTGAGVPGAPSHGLGQTILANESESSLKECMDMVNHIDSLQSHGGCLSSQDEREFGMRV